MNIECRRAVFGLYLCVCQSVLPVTLSACLSDSAISFSFLCIEFSHWQENAHKIFCNSLVL